MNAGVSDIVETVDDRCKNLAFKEDKAIAALSQLIKLADNKLNHYVASKLLYLFDREVLLETGEPAFFGRHFALHKGPIISQVNDGMKSCSANEEEKPWDWSKHFSLQNHILSQNEPDVLINNRLLSDEEVERLSNLYKKFGHAKKGVLEKHIRDLAEHIGIDEGKRQAMPYGYILEKNGFSPKQVSELLDEIEYDSNFRKNLEQSL